MLSFIYVGKTQCNWKYNQKYSSNPPATFKIQVKEWNFWSGVSQEFMSSLEGRSPVSYLGIPMVHNHKESHSGLLLL